jgi:hypothetical protein
MKQLVENGSHLVERGALDKLCDQNEFPLVSIPNRATQQRLSHDIGPAKCDVPCVIYAVLEMNLLQSSDYITIRGDRYHFDEQSADFVALVECLVQRFARNEIISYALEMHTDKVSQLIKSR